MDKSNLENQNVPEREGAKLDTNLSALADSMQFLSLGVSPGNLGTKKFNLNAWSTPLKSIENKQPQRQVACEKIYELDSLDDADDSLSNVTDLFAGQNCFEKTADFIQYYQLNSSEVSNCAPAKDRSGASASAHLTHSPNKSLVAGLSGLNSPCNRSRSPKQFASFLQVPDDLSEVAESHFSFEPPKIEVTEQVTFKLTVSPTHLPKETMVAGLSSSPSNCSRSPEKFAGFSQVPVDLSDVAESHFSFEPLETEVTDRVLANLIVSPDTPIHSPNESMVVDHSGSNSSSHCSPTTEKVASFSQVPVDLSDDVESRSSFELPKTELSEQILSKSTTSLTHSPNESIVANLSRLNSPSNCSQTTLKVASCSQMPVDLPDDAASCSSLELPKTELNKAVLPNLTISPIHLPNKSMVASLSGSNSPSNCSQTPQKLASFSPVSIDVSDDTASRSSRELPKAELSEEVLPDLIVSPSHSPNESVASLSSLNSPSKCSPDSEKSASSSQVPADVFDGAVSHSLFEPSKTDLNERVLPTVIISSTHSPKESMVASLSDSNSPSNCSRTPQTLVSFSQVLVDLSDDAANRSSFELQKTELSEGVSSALTVSPTHSPNESVVAILSDSNSPSNCSRTPQKLVSFSQVLMDLSDDVTSHSSFELPKTELSERVSPILTDSPLPHHQHTASGILSPVPQMGSSNPVCVDVSDSGLTGAYPIFDSSFEEKSGNVEACDRVTPSPSVVNAVSDLEDECAVSCDSQIESTDAENDQGFVAAVSPIMSPSFIVAENDAELVAASSPITSPPLALEERSRTPPSKCPGNDVTVVLDSADSPTEENENFEYEVENDDDSRSAASLEDSIYVSFSAEKSLSENDGHTSELSSKSPSHFHDRTSMDVIHEPMEVCLETDKFHNTVIAITADELSISAEKSPSRSDGLSFELSSKSPSNLQDHVIVDVIQESVEGCLETDLFHNAANAISAEEPSITAEKSLSRNDSLPSELSAKSSSNFYDCMSMNVIDEPAEVCLETDRFHDAVNDISVDELSVSAEKSLSKVDGLPSESSSKSPSNFYDRTSVDVLHEPVEVCLETDRFHNAVDATSVDEPSVSAEKSPSRSNGLPLEQFSKSPSNFQDPTIVDVIQEPVEVCLETDRSHNAVDAISVDEPSISAEKSPSRSDGHPLELSSKSASNLHDRTIVNEVQELVEGFLETDGFHNAVDAISAKESSASVEKSPSRSYGLPSELTSKSPSNFHDRMDVIHESVEVCLETDGFHNAADAISAEEPSITAENSPSRSNDLPSELSSKSPSNFLDHTIVDEVQELAEGFLETHRFQDAVGPVSADALGQQSEKWNPSLLTPTRPADYGQNLQADKLARVCDSMNKLMSLCTPMKDPRSHPRAPLKPFRCENVGNESQKIVFDVPTNLLDVSIGMLESMTAMMAPVEPASSVTYLDESNVASDLINVAQTPKVIHIKPNQTSSSSRPNVSDINARLLEENDNLKTELEEYKRKYDILHEEYESVLKTAHALRTNETTLKKALEEYEDETRKACNKYLILKEYADSVIMSMNRSLDLCEEKLKMKNDELQKLKGTP